MSNMADPTIQKETKTKVKMTRPKRYHVILLNDDFTPMEFVIQLLVEIFDRSAEDAIQVMMEVHQNGRGIANTYSHEIANMKSNEAMDISSKFGHPLKCTVEEAPMDA